MSAKNVLFVAQPYLVSDIFEPLKKQGYQVGLTQELQGALDYIRKQEPVCVFSIQSMSGYDVQELLASDQAQGTPVVVFAEQGDAQQAKRIMEQGAKDYWLAPLHWEKVRIVLDSLQPRESDPVHEPGPGAADREIVSQDKSMQQALALARQVAASKATVLVRGASGTGKELFARYIHEQSDRAQGPFVAVNCAALPEHLLESELFGHERGAFTGAVQRKPGKFELAHKGSILLDEISEMDFSLQAKLLRVLQEGEIDRVGGTGSVPVDVRVMATTNRDLEEYVAQGSFRQDLYYRLNVIPLHLPPLRDRPQDILLLARHFLQSFARAYSRSVPEISPQARQWLLEHDWQGNVRELQNLMERAVLLASSGRIEPAHLLLDPEALLQEQELGNSGQKQQQWEQQREADLEQDQEQEVLPLQEMEKRMIMRSLYRTSGNRTQAAKLLGVSVRTLRNKLSEYRKQGEEA
ncbi:MAG: sigma 54-interacting transcriptional regulator [Desulfohalobiaceae bacterium]